MTRRLILMRHARQGGHAATDHERPLTPEGHRQAEWVGQRLAALGLIPDRVLASTAVRCRETCEDLARQLPDRVAVELEAALYNSTADRLLDAVASVDEAVGTLLVLAHNPGISLLALALAGSREEERARLQPGFSPATVAVFEIQGVWSTVSPRTARLHGLFDPEEEPGGELPGAS